MRIDLPEPQGPAEDGEEPPVAQKWLWFFGIAGASGLVVICVAYALRATLFL